ncbi:hypothetical protein ALC57_12595 [Trachymyrmex cornetzi]|uniref:Uncharacterized protein n=1 Tax=Trachymyrmex cornetzi TaxID=471704 RepID=A0A151J0S0_9HYME|nr:hypothetical protein ALC57_12595 [Trachymyrmex cornetzi]
MKHAEGKCAGNDDRGEAPNPRKLSDDIINNVCEHIQSFPANVSHYTREHNSARKYLNENLNIRKMYMLYKEKCSELNIQPVKEYVCSIGLQKALPFPILNVSDAYYKRNMYCYNFGIHDLRENIGFFYVWDAEFNTLNIRRARHGRPLQLKNIEQENLYPSVRPISAAKKKDMLDLLKFIPPIHHTFFQQLKTIETVEDDDKSSNE